jgi:hypothetical protein
MSIAGLLDELEAEARRESKRLENAGKLEHGFTEAFYPLSAAEEREARRNNAALLLADTWDVFCALMRREKVPAHRLRRRYLDQHKARVG